MATNDPIRERAMSPVQRGSPAQFGSVKGTEGLPETLPDTEDIFNITDHEPAKPIAVPTQPPSECAEQQITNLKDKAHALLEASTIDDVEVSMEDAAAPDDLSRDMGENSVSEVQLIHAESREDRHVNLDEQLPIQKQHAGDDERPNKEEHSITDQRSTTTQRPVEDDPSVEQPQRAQAKQAAVPEAHIQDARNVSLPDAGLDMQRLQTPADTMPPALVNTQHSVRGVAGRSDSSRVAKNRKKPSQPGSIARNSSSAVKPGSNSSSYTAAQLYQLADHLKEQERLQEKQGWMKDLAAKQAELEKVDRQRSSLQNECVQFKASLKKYSIVAEKLKTVINAFNGVGKDIRALQTSKAAFDRDIRELKSHISASMDAVASLPEQIARIDKLKVNSLSLIKEYKSSISTLRKEKSDLERRLRETSSSLEQERSRQAAFDKRIETFQTERRSTEEMLKGCLGKISDRLGEFKTFIEQGTSSSETSRELLELMKKENEVISEQVRSSGTNMETVKTSVEQLSSGLEKHVRELREANNSISETRTKNENKVATALEAIKSQFKTWEDLTEKNTALQKRIVEDEQSSDSSKQKIAKLEEDLTNKINAEVELRKRIDELQSSQATLESYKASAEADKAKLLELTTSESNVKQEVEKLKGEKAESMATIASMAEQKTTLQCEKGDLQGQIGEMTRLLEDARHAVPDFGREKARVEADAQKQIDDAVNEHNIEIRRLSIDFRNEKLRLQKKKEEVDRELRAREDTVGDLQSRLDRMKQEYGNRSPAAWSEELQQKNAEIEQLNEESAEARRRSEELQQDLDSTRQSAEDFSKKRTQELLERDAQIKSLNETSTTMANKVKSLEQKLEEVKRSNEVTVNTIQEDATRKAQDAEERLETMEMRLTEADSAKSVIETSFKDLERRSNDEAGQRQKEISDLQQSLENANSRLKEINEHHTQQQEAIQQKHSDNEKLKQDIEKLKQDLAKATTATVQIPNSQPQEDSQNQASTPPTKKARRAVNRNARSISKPTSSATATSATQPTSDIPESTQPGSTGASIFRPFSKPRSHSHDANHLNSPPQEEEEMLDLDNSHFQFPKTNSRPVSSQSETQRAFSLGSQESLDEEGVRLRSQNNQSSAQTQSQSLEHVSSSSSLSEARDLGPSYRDAARYSWEETQSQKDRSQDLQQESQDVELRTQQHSLGLSNPFDELAVTSHAFETPMKASGMNLQGIGRKLTPRPESQPKQSRPGALHPVTIPKLPKGSAAASQLQKVSALSSGPHNFKTGASGKGKRVTYDDEDDDDDVYSAPSSSVRGSRSPQKRPAPQGTKTNKKQRTEKTVATTASSSQRSVIATPRRSQTTSVTPGTQRRRSTRSNKEQNMLDRFNGEISSPRVGR
ncbi:hypothetical protein E4T49_03899 [Aureobasidium sp. EXF-10728]|nr:hypothetical protein E4T49_03899 [Aureobasidium sp. EXF-10728]